MENVLEAINGIPISTFDTHFEDEFNSLMLENGEDSKDFETNFAYALQATRNHSGLLKDGNSAVLFTTRSQVESEVLAIVNYTGKRSLDLIAALSDLPSPFKTVVKNVTEKKRDELLKIGFRDYAPSESWIAFDKWGDFWRDHPALKQNFLMKDFTGSDFRFDDNTYPEYGCSISDLLKLQGKNYLNIRNKLNKFRKKYSDTIICNEYNPEIHENSCRELLDVWAANFSQKGFEKKEEAIGAHACCFTDLKNTHRHVFQDINKGGATIGFSHIIGRESTLSHIALYQDPSYSDLKNFMVASLLTSMQESNRLEGYDLITLQGSEYGSIDRFKRFFSPKRSVQKTHLIKDQ